MSLKKEEIMKKILLLLFLLFPSVSFGDNLISPIGFQDTDENRKKVLSFIEKNVKNELSSIGMDDPSYLRVIEKQELQAFKKLIKVKDTKLLRKVIIGNCSIFGMCNYDSILVIYMQEKKASNSKLKW